MAILPVQTNSIKNINFCSDHKDNESIVVKNQGLTQDTVEISKEKKGLSKNAKWGIGIGAAAIITAAALLIRGKTKAAQEEIFKLAEHIDFSPARTVEEARNFARTHLGIKNYDETMPLEVMNWVNEGLANVNNVTKGKAKMFDTIGYVPLEAKEKALACAISAKDGDEYGAILNINKTVFENMNEHINTMIKQALGRKVMFKNKEGKLDLYNFYKNNEASADLLKGLNEFSEKPDTFSLIDKIKLYEDFTSLAYAKGAFYEAPMSKLKQLMKNEGIQETLLAHSKLPDLKQLEKLTTEQQRNVLVDITNTCLSSGDRIHLAYPKGDKFRTIYHEMGHIQHQNSAGYDLYMQMGKPDECEKRFSKVSDITNDFINSKEKQQTANRVSNYAPESPSEFVAEVYRKLISNALSGGEKLSDDVMKLYAEYKGPAV